MVIVLAFEGVAPATTAAARQVTLSSSESKVTYGEDVEISGQVTGSPGTPQSCLSNVEVRIRYDPDDDVVGAWYEATRVRTADDGTFSATIRPEGSSDFVAFVAADNPPGCAESSSDGVSVLVRRKVTLVVGDTTLRSGEVARFRVSVEPECEHFLPPKDVLELRRRIEGRFVRIATAKPRSGCVARFPMRLTQGGVFQGFAPAGSPGGLGVFYLAGRSTPERIELT